VKLAAATVLVALALAAFGVAQVWDFTCDDAFITFRYSRNLARGVGPTFNTEPPRAEGYTSFLWMALASVPHLTGSDAVVAAKVMGVGLALLTAATCLATAWSLGEGADPADRWLSASLAATVFAVYPLTAVHAVSGMDTALAAFLVSLLGWLVVRGGRVPAPAIPCCALLLGLARPELNLASLAFIIAVFRRLQGDGRRRFLRSVLLWYVLPGALYFAWRVSYYGALLPLPFYVKGATLEPRGLLSALYFGVEVAGCFGLLLAVAVVNLNSRCVPILSAVLVVLLYLLHPEHVMGFGHRFFHPLVPLIAALSARGAVLLLSAVRERLGARRVALAHVGLLVVGLTPVVYHYQFVWQEFRQYARGMGNAHVRLGKLLSKYAAGEGTVLAIRDAGAVPYYSDWETVDCAGLNDPHIARAGVAAPSYVFERRPCLVVLQSRRPDKFQPHEASEQALFDECVRRGMSSVGTLEFKRDYYLWLMAYPDSALANALKAELRRPG